MKAPLSAPLAPADPIARAFRTNGVTPLATSPGTYSPELHERLVSMWRQRLAVEYRSSTIFTQLSVQLVEANAPLEMTTVMLSMAQDELRHAHGCREVLERLGHVAAVDVETSVDTLASHRGASPEERALRNVIYTTCCSELVACARFVATLETTTDPFFREAITRLLADERLHGQFGFQYVAWSQSFLASHGEVRASVSRYLRLAFATLERELAPAHVHEIDDEARTVGLECPVEARELFFGTMEEAVVPALENVGLAAADAWKRRSFELG